MANINWSFLWEAFAIAAGVPPSNWQTAPVEADENQSRYRSCQQAPASTRKPITEESAGDPDLPAGGFEKFFEEFGSTPMSEISEARIKEQTLKEEYRIFLGACH